MTFIVCGDLVANAKLLDDERLGKQRVEASQILDAISKATGWKNHPASVAWYNFANALKYYANCIIQEWINRGKNNTMPVFEIVGEIVMPWWVTWDRLHQSHRAMLIRKHPSYYHDKFDIDLDYFNYGYIWPSKVPYEMRNAPLAEITAPIAPEYINAIYCSAVLKSGSNAGSCCFRLVRDKQPYCGRHRRFYTVSL